MESIKLYKKLDQSIEREKFKDYLREHAKGNNRGSGISERIPLGELDDVSAAGIKDRDDEMRIYL